MADGAARRSRGGPQRGISCLVTVGDVARGICLPALLLLSPLGCTRGLDLVNEPPRAVALTTTGPWASMIYLARTDSGIITFDLGWSGAEGALRKGLRQLAATEADVSHVFLTHAHRDHVAGWELVPQATFTLGAGDVPYFLGERTYESLVPKLGDGMVAPAYPPAGRLRLNPVGADTAFSLGRDTVFAFTVPGHTPGSMAYLFRGILFGGDAINWRPVSGFQGARPEFSESTAQSRESVRALWARLDAPRVRVACSAHAKCAPVDERFRRATVR